MWKITTQSHGVSNSSKSVVGACFCVSLILSDREVTYLERPKHCTNGAKNICHDAVVHVNAIVRERRS